MKRPRSPSWSSLPSALLGVVVGILSLLTTSTAMTVAEAHAAVVEARQAHAAAEIGGASGNGNLATGSELLSEMESLHRALAGLQSLIQEADIPAEDEVMSQAAKLVRRVRSLVHATDPAANTDMRRKTRRENRIRERMMLRAGGIGNGQVEEVMQTQDELAGGGQQPGMEDYVTRKLYDTTLTFPECKGRFLEDCIDILNQQLLDLHMTADKIVHEKRNEDQDGYNKVVLVTDMTGTYVKGKRNDGEVEYPFLWDDSVLGYKRVLGVDGKWDCHQLSPEECCALVQNSCPNEDKKGNKLMCHIFVPFGGIGNRKRDDRVFINLSPDGRVHEAPFVA